MSPGLNMGLGLGLSRKAAASAVEPVSARVAFSNALGSNSAGWDGYSARSAIESSLFQSTGNFTQVRVTFKAHSTGALNIDNASIGAMSSLNSTDTTATPIELLFSGASGVSIAGGGEGVSDWVNFSGDLDTLIGLVVTMDMSDADADLSSVSPLTGAVRKFKGASNSYNLTSLAGASDVSDGAFYAVSKIEVR